MEGHKVVKLQSPQAVKHSCSVLDEIVRAGAQAMLQTAIEAEVNEFVTLHTWAVDENGHRIVVRNGYGQERDLVSGVGPLTIRQPRVRDRTGEQHFTSKILPPFLRRLPSIDALIPVLYLKGISTGDFSEALASILGPHAAGLSSTNIVRLKAGWEAEYEAWQKRDLSPKRYVYFWVDGLYFNIRLGPDRPCILVIMGATPEGKKEIIAVWDGERESKASWQAVLRDLKQRGLKEGPKLAIGDGALGFWSALEEEYPQTEEQRCWVHKTANILDKLPQSIQVDAKKLIHEMVLAPTLVTAKKAYREFVERYRAKYPKATDCLAKDESVLFSFYGFPAEHWKHIRTTNPIESTFATVRHRTRQTKGSGSRTATLTMVFKLALEAERHWLRLNGKELLGKVLSGVKFTDGQMKEVAA